VQTQATWRSRAAITVAALTVPAVGVASVLSDSYRWVWTHDAWAKPVFVMHLLSVAGAVWGGAFLVWRRPANRCGYVAIALGVVFGTWLVAVYLVPEDGWWGMIPPILVWSLRPLLFWVVLAYPIGRLDRPGRRLFGAFLIAQIVVFAVVVWTWDEFSVSPWEAATWTYLTFSAWWDVGSLLWLTAIVVVVQRRRLRFRGAAAAPIMNASWIAALTATGADFVMVAQGPLRNLMTYGENSFATPYGMVLLLIDYARWGLVIAVLALAARRTWPREYAPGASVDIDAAALDKNLRDTLVRALGDPNADVAIADGKGGWVDGTGSTRTAPGTERAAAMVLRDGEPIAALEFDDDITAHPGLIDTGVTALALQLEARHQETLAAAREQELRGLARSVLDAEDRARRRLERDLHDGAQQALVGVTLQAALAARANGGGASGSGDAHELAESVDSARDELLGIASGRPPALLAERGLDGALGALVLTAGLPVRVQADPCGDLPDHLQRAIWFTAAEAVTNAVKHANASSLELSLLRASGTVTLTVCDNGRGGVDHAPSALSARVDEADGRLDIESGRRGTVVCARFTEVST
jgi:signal transduction histidine kinase